MKKYGLSLVLLPILVACVAKTTSSEAIAPGSESCDVIVVGGSTAALAAAISSADSGVKTCLLEPTNWPGGQMTASAVSAIDFPHHRPNGMKLPEASLEEVNWNKTFSEAMNSFRGNPGKCWVSHVCYEPKIALQKTIFPMISKRSANLKVFYDTTVISVLKNKETIVSLRGVKRKPIRGTGYTNLLSQDLADWYSPVDSKVFKKQVITFTGSKNKNPVVIDASEFGDVMVLADSPYLQGVEVTEDSMDADELCGQAIVYPFVLESVAKSGKLQIKKASGSNDSQADQDSTPPQYSDEGKIVISGIEKANGSAEIADGDIAKLENGEKFDTGIPNTSTDMLNFFSFEKFNWSQIWSYRRIRASGKAAGDMSLQNWFPGNDYPGGYFLKSRAAAQAEKTRWAGGVDLNVLKRAENQAFAWAAFYAERTPANLGINIKLDKNLLGTEHGLAKMPYVRDTRRSIGIDNFLLKFKDLNGTATGSIPIGTPFKDRIAIGAYVADFHNVQKCPRRDYLNEHGTLPFYIPFRALTNKKTPNLLVAGKTMAQTYHANAATRLQPIEWNTGAAAGIAAAMMIKRNLASTQKVLESIADLQKEVLTTQPIDWTIDGKKFPQ